MSRADFDLSPSFKATAFAQQTSQQLGQQAKLAQAGFS
jgi:hypothetical protein